jgi:hypothetical protein
MATKRGVVVLPAAGTFTQDTFDTNISADSKIGYAITGFKAYMRSRDATGVEVPESNLIECILSTKITTITTPDEDEEIARVGFALAFSTAAGFAVPEPSKRAELLEPRLTVQPNLYIGVKGSVTVGAITDIYYEIAYDVIKLTDIELLRLLVGGV